MSPDTLSGWPPFLVAPLFAIVLYGVALALGYRLLRVLRLRPSGADRWEHGFLCVAIGTGILQLVPCILAAFGRMTPSAVRIACLALVALLSPDLLRVGTRVFAAVADVLRKRWSPAVVTWVALLGVLLGIQLVRALVFRSFGDDDGYHLSAPKRWLESGTLHYLPTYTHTNASLGFEMLYVIALSFTDVIGAKVLHYGAGLFTLVGLVLSARRLGNAYAGLAAISLLLIQTPLINLPLLFTVAYADFGAAWMAVATVLLWLLWREDKSWPAFACFALCAGLAGAYKFTSLALGVAWAPALLLESRRSGFTWPRSLGMVVRFGAISVIPVVPWLVRNFLVTGNPLYPLLASIIPTRDWTAEHAKIFSRYVRFYSWGVSEGAELGDGARRAILLATGVLILVAGAIAVRLIRRAVLRSVLVFSVTFALISVALTGLIFRYWLPAILGAVLAIVVALAEKWPRPAWRYPLASALLAVAIARVALAENPRTFVKNVKIATGISTFSREYPDDAGWNMWQYINANTPADARVLAAAFYTTTGSSSFGGFWVDRPFYVTDSHLQTFLRLDTWPSFVKSVQSSHITHVLIFRGQFSANRHGFSFAAQQNEYPFCRRLVDEYGARIRQEGELQLFEVDPARALEEATSPPVRAADEIPEMGRAIRH